MNAQCDVEFVAKSWNNVSRPERNRFVEFFLFAKLYDVVESVDFWKSFLINRCRRVSWWDSHQRNEEIRYCKLENKIKILCAEMSFHSASFFKRNKFCNKNQTKQDSYHRLWFWIFQSLIHAVCLIDLKRFELLNACRLPDSWQTRLLVNHSSEVIKIVWEAKWVFLFCYLKLFTQSDLIISE